MYARERSNSAAKPKLAETCNINKSLFVLTNVINKLQKLQNEGNSQKQSLQHIPYRDSKLTQILKTSLGGSAMTAIICMVTPVCKKKSDLSSNIAWLRALQMNISSLRFGTRAHFILN